MDKWETGIVIREAELLHSWLLRLRLRGSISAPAPTPAPSKTCWRLRLRLREKGTGSGALTSNTIFKNVKCQNMTFY